MPADVQDVERDAVIVELDRAQAVAGQLVAGAEGPGEAEPGDVGGRAGQERLLDPRGGPEVARHPAVGRLQVVIPLGQPAFELLDLLDRPL